MPSITPHESDAELFSPEDVDKDFSSLTNALLEKQIHQLTRELLQRSDVYFALRKLVVNGHFANEIEALSHAIRTLQFAISAKEKAS
jgi:translation elongation factor EF-1beta